MDDGGSGGCVVRTSKQRRDAAERRACPQRAEAAGGESVNTHNGGGATARSKRLEQIGHELKRLREARGLGIRAAARAAGMNPGSYLRAERGVWAVPASRIGGLVKALGPQVCGLLQPDQLSLADAVRVSGEQEAALRAILRHAAKQQVLSDLLAAADFEIMSLPDGSLFLRAVGNTAAQTAAAGAGGPP